MKVFFICVLIILIGVVFYGLTFRGVFGNPQPNEIMTTLSTNGSPFESSHERSPYALLIALTTYGRGDLTQQLADMGSADVSYYNGKFFSYFPPGLTFLIIPTYLLGVQYGLAQITSYLTITFFSILSLLTIFFITKNTFKAPIWAAILAALIFGFATTSWSYASTIYQHAVTTFLLLSSFYATWKFGQSKISGIIYASYIWLSYGFAILLDYPNVLLFVPIIVYFLLLSFKLQKSEDKYIFKFRMVVIITFIIFIGVNFIHGYYNYVNYGDWKKFAQSFPRYQQGNLEQLQTRITLAKQQALVDQASGLIRRKPGDLQEESLVFGLYELLIADDKGIFFFSPILICGIFGIIMNIKKIKIEEGILVASILTNIFIYASFHDPWGGYAYGPRYLISSMAILSIFSANWLVRLERWYGQLVLFILFAYSSFIALLGALTTNMIPPITEANYFHLPFHNFLMNLDFIHQGKNSSLVYNTYLRSISPIDFLFIVYLMLIFIVFLVLGWSLFDRKEVIKTKL